jgi:membrane peptidoglycan carboxypeptidase
VAVWIGNVKPARANGKLLTLNHKCFGDYGCRAKVFGGTIAAPVWAEIMHAATDALPVVKFTEPSERVKNGNYIKLPDVVGDSVDTATQKLEEAGFKVKVGDRVDSSVSEGRVARTSPSTRAPKGGEITLFLSRGYSPPAYTAPAYTPPPRTQPEPRTTPKPTATAPAPKPKKTPPPKK